MATDLFERHAVIDVDTHVTEPPDVFTARVASKWGDAVPHIERIDDYDVWMANGDRIARVGVTATAGYKGRLARDPPRLRGHPARVARRRGPDWR